MNRILVQTSWNVPSLDIISQSIGLHVVAAAIVIIGSMITWIYTKCKSSSRKNNLYFVERCTKSCLKVFSEPVYNPLFPDLTLEQYLHLGQMSFDNPLDPHWHFLITIPDKEIIRRARKRATCEKDVDDAFLAEKNQRNQDVFMDDPKTIVFSGLTEPEVLARQMYNKAQSLKGNSKGTVIISLEAGVGAGKSTTMKIMQEKYGAQVIEEPVETYWKAPLETFFPIMGQYQNAILNGHVRLSVVRRGKLNMLRQKVREAKFNLQKACIRWFQAVTCAIRSNKTWTEIQEELQLN